MINIIYEDNHLLVIEKPINIPVQEDSSKDKDLLTMLKEYIKKRDNKPGNVYLGLVHRLDRPVGGIMVFARSSKAASRLCKAFNEHKITKKYLAIVKGKVDTSGEYVDYLAKDKDGKAYVCKDGKKAVLNYELVEYNKENDCSLVSVDLKTGRHHQIRIQFASRGHYLLGDQRYGVLDNKQISLFSYYLSFTHPVSNEVLEFKVFPEKKNYWTIFTL